jgi:hypothetical protein
MNYSDIVGSCAQPWPSAQQGGGLLGQGFGGMAQRMSLFGNGQRFPQYGGNSRTAQMMNQYMGGLLSPRQSYMPPALQAPQRQVLQQSYMPQQYMPQDAWTTQFGPMQNHAGGI